MKITGPSELHKPADTKRKNRKSESPDSASFDSFMTGGASETEATGSVSALTPSQALLALQEVNDDEVEQRQAVKRGEEMLEILDAIRMGLLKGAVSRPRLERLLELTQSRREQFTQKELSEVLEEIETRAAVELAKLDFTSDDRE